MCDFIQAVNGIFRSILLRVFGISPALYAESHFFILHSYSAIIRRVSLGVDSRYWCSETVETLDLSAVEIFSKYSNYYTKDRKFEKVCQTAKWQIVVYVVGFADEP